MAKDIKKYNKHAGNGAGGALYFVGFLGAFVYYWQITSGLWEHTLGFVKAIFWPAFMVYELFKFLQVS